MRVRITILLVLIAAIVGGSRPAAAEKVKTNQSTKLYSRPGEQAPVILTVKEGQGMTVLAREGRWIKVRVQGRTGYVPRSKVDAPDGEQIARNTRRRSFVDGRSTQRGAGGEGPDDRVGADATGDGADAGGGDDDSKAKPAPKGKPASKGDDDDDDDSKKPAPKAKPAPKGKPASKGDDDDDDDSKKPAPKTKPAPKGKPASKGDDDDDDDSKKPAPKAKPAPKSKPASKGDDDDDDGGKGKSHGKGGEDENPLDDGKGDDGKGKGGDDTAEAKTDERAIAHVSEKTSVHDDPDKNSSEAFVARPKDKLYVGEVTGKYTFVETDEGDAGYVLTSKLDSAAGPLITGRYIQANARLGFTIIGQSIHSTGGTGAADNLTVSSTTANIALGGTILYPKNRWLLGGDAAYEYGKSLVALGEPGMGSTGFTLHELDLRATAGYDLRNKYGVVIYGRLGLHYEVFHVADVTDLMTKNTALVPSESYLAPTIGVAVDAVHVTPRIGARITLDAVAFGSSVTQTKNLEDGATPTGQSIFFGLGAVYHWKPEMDLIARYDLNYGMFDFGKPLTASERVHTGSDTSRTDVYNTLTFGVTRAF